MYGQKKYKRDCNKIQDDFFTNEKTILEHAPKLVEILKIIEENKNEKGYIYSQFLDSGILPLRRYLLTKNFSEFDIHKNDNKHTFCVLSGDTDDILKDKYIKIFNSEQNTNGELIMILLISSAVSQGISLKGMRYIIIMEPYWNWTRIKQVIGRGIRYDSHLHLPENERNVTPYILISHIDKNNPTTDEDLYIYAKNNQDLIMRFLDLLKRASIDCFNHVEHNNCFICKPTNIPLYLNDIFEDLKTPLTCEKWVTVDVNVKEIIYNDKKYYWSVDDTGFIRIYKWNDFLHTYDELYINDKNYKDIYLKIKNR